jgi:hypothetical protein
MSRGLTLAQLEAGHEPLAGLGGGLRGADDGDHLVEMFEGNREALEQVRPRAGLGEVVAGAAPHDLAAEVDEVAQRPLEGQHLRPLVDQRQQVHAEGRLEGRLLVELVQDHLFRRVRPELDHDPHALAARLVPEVGDAVDPAFAHEVGDPLDQRRLVHHEGDLGDDDAQAALRLLEAGPRAHCQQPPAGGVGGADSLAPADDGTGGEVGPRHLLEQLVDAALGTPGLEDEGVHQLAQVVGRDVGGHPDRDARGAVGQQVRKPGRQDRGLGDSAVEVRDEVDRLAIDVPEHLLGQRVQPRLGVAVGGGGVAVDRAEVALAVDQRVPQREVLGHADHRVVDGRVAVRVVVLQHLPHHAGGLRVAAIGEQALLVHCE